MYNRTKIIGIIFAITTTLMNFISTIINVVSLYKLYTFVKKINSGNMDFSLNRKGFFIHLILLVLTNLVSFFALRGIRKMLIL